MKHTAFITILLMLALTACDKNKPAQTPVAPTAPSPAEAMSSGLPSLNMPATTMALPASAPSYVQSQKATVVSTIDVPQFTYIEISQNGANRWLAAKTVALKKGDVIKFDSGSTMENFNSKSLNRTFPSITFVNTVSIATGN